jgi:hypothetical protein
MHFAVVGPATATVVPKLLMHRTKNATDYCKTATVGYIASPITSTKKDQLKNSVGCCMMETQMLGCALLRRLGYGQNQKPYGFHDPTKNGPLITSGCGCSLTFLSLYTYDQLYEFSIALSMARTNDTTMQSMDYITVKAI